MILKGISVNQNPPAKDYLWITPKGNTRFWNQSTWKLIGGSGDTEGSGFLSTALFDTYINGNTDYLAKFTGPHTVSHSFLKIGYNSGSNENYLEFGTTDNVSSRIYYDATHKALRVTGGIYADWVSALGPTGEIGSGGSSNAIDWTALGTEGNEVIHISHIPDLSSVYQLKLPTTGSASSTYAINISGNAATATSATSAISAGKWSTARTFKIKDIASNYGNNVSVDGSSSTYELPMPANIKVTSLTIGNAKLTFDDSSDVNMLKIDGVSGQTFNGIYSTKAISALGGNPLNGVGGSSGVDWGVLGTYDNDNSHTIRVEYLDGIINTSNLPINLTSSGNGSFLKNLTYNASTGVFTVTKGNISASDIPLVDLTNKVTGILPIANGGTGENNLNKFKLLSRGTLIAYTQEVPGDFNSYTELGTYYSSGGNSRSTTFTNMSNKPSDSGGFKLSVEELDNALYIRQTLNIKNGNSYSRVYNISGDSWTSWRKHLTSADIVGTINYIPKFTGTSTLTNSRITDNGSIINVGNKLQIGNIYIEWEADSSGSNNGRLKISNSVNNSTAGIYADWISALGANPSGESSGSGDLDIPTLWSEVLTQSDGGLSNYQNETINSNLIPVLSITDKTSGTLPINRGGTGRTTSPTITVNLASTSTGTSLLPSSGNVSTGITGTLPIANGGTGATSVKGAEYNILSEASTALETDFNNTTRFAIERTNPSSTNGILCGYRTASQLWSYIKGKMSSDSAVNISGNAATATILQTTRTINGTNFNGSANITTSTWGTARNISISDADGTNTGTAIGVNGGENKTLKLPSTIKATLNGNADTASKLKYNSTITYGAQGLQMYCTTDSENYGTPVNGTTITNPTDTYYYHLMLNYWNTNGYYLDIAAGLWSKGGNIYYRKVSSGTVYDWVKFLDSENYSSYALPRYNSNLTAGYIPKLSTTGQTDLANSIIFENSNGIGIGTTSPTYTLDVSGKIRTTNTIIAHKYNSANNLPAITLNKPGSYAIGIGADGTSNRIKFGPCVTLAGDAWVEQNTFNSNQWFFQGYIHATNGIDSESYVTALATNSSDKRLKKEIKPFNAKQIIDKLSPVEFEWNKKANKYNSNLELNKKNYGLIAQDSDGIIDNLVFDLPDGKGYKGVRYEKLIPILLQAVKEQQKEIDELKQIIKKLKV